MITFYIDELLPCLKEVATGEIFDTEVVRLKRKSFLAKYNERTGWYVNWSQFDADTEIYGLVLKGSVDIQGLIAVRPNNEEKALDVLWACVSPENNIWRYDTQKYAGVGGHLLAIAGDVSVRKGFDGFLVGEAADRDLFEYYQEKYNALPLPPINNPYRIMFSDAAVASIREVYTYEWTDSII